MPVKQRPPKIKHNNNNNSDEEAEQQKEEPKKEYILNHNIKSIMQ
jgi:hypothetical protein